MTRTPYPGASWCDGWPSGEQVRLYEHDHLQTHIGRIDLPLGESWGLLFLKCTPEPFRIGGKLHDSGDVSLVQEWIPNTGWLAERPSPTGRCVYVGNALVDTLPAGYSCVDEITGLPVSYVETYGPMNGISQWCWLGDLLIGQAHDPIVAEDQTGLILWDGQTHRLIEPGLCPAYTAHRIGEAVTINLAKNGYAVRIDCTMAELRALPPVVTPEPPPVDPRPIGPVGPPRPADGRLYDLARYVCDPALSPKRGPSHTLGVIRHGERFYFVKFAGNEPDAAQGQCHEAWSLDANWIYQLYDRSSGPAICFSDPRMFPRKMTIGEQHAFITGPHEILRRDTQCNEVAPREPVNRKMWLHDVADWYWGADHGVLETVMLVYDGTAGFYDFNRNVEVGYYAKGGSLCRWEPHHSNLVYATGKAVFSDASRADRKDFYFRGGPNPEPQIIPCLVANLPSYPPWPPTPDPPPAEPYYRVRMYP